MYSASNDDFRVCGRPSHTQQRRAKSQVIDISSQRSQLVRSQIFDTRIVEFKTREKSARSVVDMNC